MHRWVQVADLTIDVADVVDNPPPARGQWHRCSGIIPLLLLVNRWRAVADVILPMDPGNGAMAQLLKDVVSR